MFLPFGVYLGLTIFQNLDSQKIKFLIGAFIISTIVFQNIKKNNFNLNVNYFEDNFSASKLLDDLI